MRNQATIEFVGYVGRTYTWNLQSLQTFLIPTGYDH